MKDGWRFRSGWGGRLILQRRVVDLRYMMETYTWVDAGVEDLAEFWK